MPKSKSATRKTAVARSIELFEAPPTISRKDFFRNKSDDWFRDFLYRLVQALSRLTLCREAFGREAGLTASQFVVLMGVAYRQGVKGVSIAALAAHTGLASTHVTTEVGRLVRRGLLEKCGNAEDRRGVLVSLSPEGEQAVTTITPFVRQINDILFKDILPEQIRVANEFAFKLLVNSEYAMAEMKTRSLLRKSKR